MNESYLSNLNHDLSFRPGIIREALEKGVQFGTKEFFVYSQLRWYETDGKFGFCAAGLERLGEDVGMSAEEVKDALRGLKDAGLVEHVWCDKRIYRNKTKLWISTVRLASVCTNVDAMRVLKKGAKNTAMLAKTTSGNVETGGGPPETGGGPPETGGGPPETGGGPPVRSPVITEVGNTNRNTNKKNKQKNLQKNFFNDGVNEGFVVNQFVGKEDLNVNTVKPFVGNTCNQVVGKSVNQAIGKETLNVDDVTRSIGNSVNSNKKLKDSENPVNDDFIKEVLSVAGYSVSNTNVIAARPSCIEALKLGISKDDILQAARCIKDYRGTAHRSVRSPFQNTSFWMNQRKEEKSNGYKFNF